MFANANSNLAHCLPNNEYDLEIRTVRKELVTLPLETKFLRSLNQVPKVIDLCIKHSLTSESCMNPALMF